MSGYPQYGEHGERSHRADHCTPAWPNDMQDTPANDLIRGFAPQMPLPSIAYSPKCCLHEGEEENDSLYLSSRGRILSQPHDAPARLKRMENARKPVHIPYGYVANHASPSTGNLHDTFLSAHDPISPEKLEELYNRAKAHQDREFQRTGEAPPQVSPVHNELKAKSDGEKRLRKNRTVHLRHQTSADRGVSSRFSPYPRAEHRRSLFREATLRYAESRLYSPEQRISEQYMPNSTFTPIGQKDRTPSRPTSLQRISPEQRPEQRTSHPPCTLPQQREKISNRQTPGYIELPKYLRRDLPKPSPLVANGQSYPNQENQYPGGNDRKIGDPEIFQPLNPDIDTDHGGKNPASTSTIQFKPKAQPTASVYASKPPPEVIDLTTPKPSPERELPPPEPLRLTRPSESSQLSQPSIPNRPTEPQKQGKLLSYFQPSRLLESMKDGMNVIKESLIKKSTLKRACATLKHTVSATPTPQKRTPRKRTRQPSLDSLTPEVKRQKIAAQKLVTKELGREQANNDLEIFGEVVEVEDEQKIAERQAQRAEAERLREEMHLKALIREEAARIAELEAKKRQDEEAEKVRIEKEAIEASNKLRRAAERKEIEEQEKKELELRREKVADVVLRKAQKDAAEKAEAERKLAEENVAKQRAAAQKLNEFRETQEKARRQALSLSARKAPGTEIRRRNDDTEMSGAEDEDSLFLPIPKENVDSDIGTNSKRLNDESSREHLKQSASTFWPERRKAKAKAGANASMTYVPTPLSTRPSAAPTPKTKRRRTQAQPRAIPKGKEKEQTSAGSSSTTTPPGTNYKPATVTDWNSEDETEIPSTLLAVPPPSHKTTGLYKSANLSDLLPLSIQKNVQVISDLEREKTDKENAKAASEEAKRGKRRSRGGPKKKQNDDANMEKEFEKVFKEIEAKEAKAAEKAERERKRTEAMREKYKENLINEAKANGENLSEEELEQKLRKAMDDRENRNAKRRKNPVLKHPDLEPEDVDPFPRWWSSQGNEDQPVPSASAALAESSSLVSSSSSSRESSLHPEAVSSSIEVLLELERNLLASINRGQRRPLPKTGSTSNNKARKLPASTPLNIRFGRSEHRRPVPRKWTGPSTSLLPPEQSQNSEGSASRSLSSGWSLSSSLQCVLEGQSHENHTSGTVEQEPGPSTLPPPTAKVKDPKASTSTRISPSSQLFVSLLLSTTSHLQNPQVWSLRMPALPNISSLSYSPFTDLSKVPSSTSLTSTSHNGNQSAEIYPSTTIDQSTSDADMTPRPFMWDEDREPGPANDAINAYFSNLNESAAETPDNSLRALAATRGAAFHKAASTTNIGQLQSDSESDSEESEEDLGDEKSFENSKQSASQTQSQTHVNGQYEEDLRQNHSQAQSYNANSQGTEGTGCSPDVTTSNSTINFGGPVQAPDSTISFGNGGPVQQPSTPAFQIDELEDGSDEIDIGDHIDIEGEAESESEVDNRIRTPQGIRSIQNEGTDNPQTLAQASGTPILVHNGRLSSAALLTPAPGPQGDRLVNVYVVKHQHNPGNGEGQIYIGDMFLSLEEANIMAQELVQEHRTVYPLRSIQEDFDESTGLFNAIINYAHAKHGNTIIWVEACPRARSTFTQEQIEYLPQRIPTRVYLVTKVVSRIDIDEQGNYHHHHGDVQIIGQFSILTMANTAACTKFCELTKPKSAKIDWVRQHAAWVGAFQEHMETCIEEGEEFEYVVVKGGDQWAWLESDKIEVKVQGMDVEGPLN